MNILQTAIDRLHLGKEKEVHILDFDGYRSKTRFICPECGEYVFPAVGQKNSFKHPKGKGLDCERRVDGQSLCTFYERVGLPLYLRRAEDVFTLNIGFSAVSKELIELASSKKAKLEISSGNYYGEKNIFNIDSINFPSEAQALLQINFIPPNENNFVISITDNLVGKQLLKYWANYSDGFSFYGALFSFSENGGKKIRKNDTIQPNTKYYWAIPSGHYQNQSGLNGEYISNIYLNRNSYDIYVISINHKNQDDFSKLATYFWNKLKVRLLYVKSEIIPIWPPIIKTEQYCVSLKCNDKSTAQLCKIISDNDKPVVYRYFGNNHSEIPVYRNDEGNYWSALILSKSIQPFTVDRKYLANSILLCQKAIAYFPKKYTYALIDLDLLRKENDCLFIDNSCTLIKIKSEKRLSVLVWNKYKPLSYHFLQNEESYDILLEKQYFEVWIIDEATQNLLTIIKKNNATKSFGDSFNNFDELDCIRIIKKHAAENPIPIPRKYRNLIINFRTHSKCFPLVSNVVAKGKIQPSILKYFISGGYFNE